MLTAKQLIAKLQKLDPETRILGHDSEWGSANIRGVSPESYNSSIGYWNEDDKDRPREGEPVAFIMDETTIVGDNEL